MAMSAQVPTLAYQWTKYTSYAYQPTRASIVGLALLGIAGCVASFALSVPLVSLGFLVVLFLPVAMLMRFRTKLVIVEGGVAIYRQPIYMNPLTWFVVLSAIASGGLFVAMALGYSQAWRLLVPAVCGVLLAVMLGVVSYRDRGPLLIRGDGVECGNGAVYEFSSATMSFDELKNGVPTIALTSPDVANGRVRRVTNRLYNIDFNTLLSTVDQLQMWHREGRATSPAGIKAMLTVAPPDDVEVGESVQVEVLVEDGCGHR